MQKFVGIDLGTTNSASAIFDGDSVQVVRDSRGGSLTPSAVYFAKSGRVDVGARAFRQLERDPANARTGFKRLMGTNAQFLVPNIRAQKTPIELSAELLRALREGVAEQIGFSPDRAVITVPALFDLPQCRATADAAKQAGFQSVEFVQEPVASALAAGWNAETEGHWLVYDIGGGTFDVTLLETADGFLRVVGHDGHNYLGGRDFDREVFTWLKAELGAELPGDLEDDAPLARALQRVCEEAKIQLSRKDSVILEPLDVIEDDDGREIEFAVELQRTTYNSLIRSSIDKSIDICRRLLAAHHVDPASLAHVVLVGGPCSTPLVREIVQEELGHIAPGNLDPMTLVAEGAALHAAMLDMSAQGAKAATADAPLDADVLEVDLQYPKMCRDKTPFVVGRVTNDPSDKRLSFQVSRADYQSERVPLDEDGTFVLELLLEQRLNTFTLHAFDALGQKVDVRPNSISITQGISIGDPTVARSVGVALASDNVKVFFERGSPLPAERTYQFFTVNEVVAGDSNSKLTIPLVQGEFRKAHICQPVGEIQVTGSDVQKNIKMGKEVEVTLTMDRGGNLKVSAHFPETNAAVHGAVRLLTPNADKSTMVEEVSRLRHSLEDTQERLSGTGVKDLVKRCARLKADVEHAGSVLATLNDEQSERAHQIRVDLLNLALDVYLLDEESRWPEVDEEIESMMSNTMYWASVSGSEDEAMLIQKTMRKLQHARERKQSRTVTQLLSRLDEIGTACANRSPDLVRDHFLFLKAQLSQAIDARQMKKLIKRGSKAVADDDVIALRQINREMNGLLPGSAEEQQAAFGSGVM